MKPEHDEQADRLEEQTTPETPVIYEAVRRLGDQEMRRPTPSLLWSGLAAGLSMGFSLLAQAILHHHLPPSGWRELVTALGYPVGFLMVVLSRQQLFTETTITVLLPLLAEPTARKFASAGRLWGLVLASNLVGTALAAAFVTWTPAVDAPLRSAMTELSAKATGHGPIELAVQAVVAGYLMAAMVWLITSAGSGQVAIVTLMTYLIGVGGFAHVIAGSVESFLLVFNGHLDFSSMLAGFTLPVLAGNIVGGTLLFAMLSYAQVMHEME